MCAIVGEEGMGKSYTSLRIGELLDRSFSADNVFFRPDPMLQRLRDGDFSTGDVWVLDEAGVALGNRTWQDTGQVKLNQALQLIRSHNVGFVFTLPRLQELDKQARGRLQNVYHIQSKNDGKYVRGRWWQSSVDRMGMTASSRDIWWDLPEMGTDKIESVDFAPPSEHIVKPYEERKSEFQDEVYETAMEELADDEQAGDDDSLTDPADIAADIIDDDPHQYVREINNGAQRVFDKNQVGAEYDIGSRKQKRVKAIVEKRSDMDGVL
jgi:ABC-type dipeptide/oligopeptide/nickel transport system ATPase component